MSTYWNDERNNFERLNEAFTQVENPINVFLHSQLFSSEIKTVGLYVLQRHTRPCLYCGKPQQEETSQALFDYVGKNTKYIVICAAADWTKYSSVIIFVNFFFSFGAQSFTSLQIDLHQGINREMHFIEFFRQNGICVVVSPDNIKEHPATAPHENWDEKVFLVDVCLFLKRHKKIGEAGKGVVGNIDIKNIYTVIAKNSIQPEP